MPQCFASSICSTAYLYAETRSLVIIMIPAASLRCMKSLVAFFSHQYQKDFKKCKVCISILSLSNLALIVLVFMQALIHPRTHLSPSPPCRDDSAVYLAGLGTVGIELYDQVPELDAVIVPAGGQSRVLVGTAAAIKHLNPHISVIVCLSKIPTTIRMQTILLFLFFKAYSYTTSQVLGDT